MLFILITTTRLRKSRSMKPFFSQPNLHINCQKQVKRLGINIQWLREREINLTNPMQISHNQQPFWPLLALISKFSSLPHQKYGSPRFEK